MPGATNSFLLAMPFAPSSFLLLEVRPGAPSSFLLLIAMPFAALNLFEVRPSAGDLHGAIGSGSRTHVEAQRACRRVEMFVFCDKFRVG